MITDSTTGSGGPRQCALRGVFQSTLRNKPFVACAGLLLLFATGFQIMTWNYSFRKKPLPLKEELSLLNKERLAPYRLVRPEEIEPAVLDQLGTREYVQWIMQEPDSAAGPGRHLALFVTYYTGSADTVPHVPDDCYRGSGFDVVSETQDSITITAGGREVVVPLHILEFRKARQFIEQRSRIVIYTFHANGQFRNDRTAVRLVLGSLSERYAYHSKLELSMDLDARTTKAQAIASLKEFCRVVTPVLLEEHWPDWETARK